MSWFSCAVERERERLVSRLSRLRLRLVLPPAPPSLSRSSCTGQTSVLCIRDVYRGSRIRIFSIPDPNFSIPDPGSEFLPSRIRQCHQKFKYFNPKKWFLSSRKYDPGYSSWDPDPDFLLIRIPDPGVKKRHRIPDL
jgi:hypothetical protein